MSQSLKILSTNIGDKLFSQFTSLKNAHWGSLVVARGYQIVFRGVEN